MTDGVESVQIDVQSDGYDHPDDYPDQLNLGCGEDYRDGDWYNVDISPAVGPDECFDLDSPPWPFPSDTFDTVLARHVVEHLDKQVAAIRECARVLTPGGRLRIAVPLGVDADTDPTHQTTWTWDTPTYFDVDGPYRWEAGTALRLETRTVDIWGHAPIEHISPVLKRAAGRWPRFIPELPGVSGELTAEYVALDGGDAE